MADHPTITALARTFKTRAENFNLRGKKRDELACEFFLGASMGAEHAGDKQLSQTILAIASLLICTRGYAAVLELAGK